MQEQRSYLRSASGPSVSNGSASGPNVSNGSRPIGASAPSPGGDIGAAPKAPAESAAIHRVDSLTTTVAPPDPEGQRPNGSASQSSEERVHAEPPRAQLDSGGTHVVAHLENDFFARGDDIASLRPASFDTPEIELFEVRRPIPPRVLARRARMRRVVAGFVGTAGVLTVMIIGAKAWTARRPTVHDSETSLYGLSRALPSIDVTEAPQVTAQVVGATAQPSAVANTEESVPRDVPRAEVQPHRLPVVDVEIPAAPDAATDRAWETAAQSLSAQDFRGADKAFAELGRRADAATRETARLARAVWWIANGKQAEVRPVIADLAANATTPSVQRQARELLLAN
jgi:hypothetical protein